MEKFVKGDVVVIPFPFSDLSGTKKRPALVVADLHGDDIILCQITSHDIKDHYAIPLSITDFKSGSLHVHSNIRPNKIFTADKEIIAYKAAAVDDKIMEAVTGKIIEMISK
jgi:mRNA interferase MazF